MAAEAHTLSTYPVRPMGWLACVVAVLAMLAAIPLAAQPPAQGPPAPAEEAAARLRKLDELFSRLGATKEESEADGIVSRIWELWQQSGDSRLDAAMHQAILLMAGAPGEALPILDDIVARKPEWAEGWNKRATALYLIGEYDRSLADIDRVLALEPRHFGALAGIGLIRIEKGEPREALAAFRRALAVNPFLRERHGVIPQLERELGERPI